MEDRMVTPSMTSTGLLLVVSLSLAVGIVWALFTGARRAGFAPVAARRLTFLTAAGLALWMAVTGIVAGRGMLLDVNALPPPLFRVFLPGLLLTALLAFLAPGRALSRGHGWALLIGYQAYRIPVEIMLARLFAEGVIPEIMTWHGRNWDVITGVTALPVAWLAATGRIGRRGILLWNLLGLALLVNVVTHAILSVPGPLQVFTAPPVLTLPLGFPFIWLPMVIVLAALLGHLLVFRKLWGERRNS
jgi:hypothetical protein